LIEKLKEQKKNEKVFWKKKYPRVANQRARKLIKTMEVQRRNPMATNGIIHAVGLI
jgi:hypothetical protein